MDTRQLDFLDINDYRGRTDQDDPNSTYRSDSKTELRFKIQELVKPFDEKRINSEWGLFYVS